MLFRVLAESCERKYAGFQKLSLHGGEASTMLQNYQEEGVKLASIPPSLDSSISTVKMTYRCINTPLLFD